MNVFIHLLYWKKSGRITVKTVMIDTGKCCSECGKNIVADLYSVSLYRSIKRGRDDLKIYCSKKCRGKASEEVS